jgi:hypothetical protein
LEHVESAFDGATLVSEHRISLVASWRADGMWTTETLGNATFHVKSGSAEKKQFTGGIAILRQASFVMMCDFRIFDFVS